MTDAVEDPYAVLGVAKDATADQIRRAYETKLNAAAAANAMRTAQRIDAAYSVLRDPYRRAAFDRDGTILELPRLGSDLPPSPPDRPSNWGGAAGEPSRPGKRRRRRGLRTALVLSVTLSLVGAALQFGLLRHAGGKAFANDVWGAQAPIASGTWFPMKQSLHRTRLIPGVNAPAAAGPHAFLIPGGSTPAYRWDPCSSIRYVISGNEPFPGANKQLTSAIEELSADTGLQLVYAGTTTEIPTSSRLPYQPTMYGNRWAPVLIAWTDSAAVKDLAGKVVGIGGPIPATVGGQTRVVSGLVAFDDPDLAGMARRRNGAVETREVMLHELGHLVGLGHVKVATQVMYPNALPLAHYGAGDKSGLAILGDGPCPTTY